VIVSGFACLRTHRILAGNEPECGVENVCGLTGLARHSGRCAPSLRSKEQGYNPTIFIGIRHQYGTLVAIERLVQSGDIQSRFKRLNQLSLSDWTIESAVTKFPTEFSRNAQQCAEWRLRQVRPDSKSSE
jgi:hypothetical protein